MRSEAIEISFKFFCLCMKQLISRSYVEALLSLDCDFRCSAVWSSGSQSQDDDLTKPQRNILLLKQPMPVLWQLSFTQSFRGSVEANEGSLLGWTVNWTDLAVLSRLLLQNSRILKL